MVIASTNQGQPIPWQLYVTAQQREIYLVEYLKQQEWWLCKQEVEEVGIQFIQLRLDKVYLKIGDSTNWVQRGNPSTIHQSS